MPHTNVFLETCAGGFGVKMGGKCVAAPADRREKCEVVDRMIPVVCCLPHFGCFLCFGCPRLENPESGRGSSRGVEKGTPGEPPGSIFLFFNGFLLFSCFSYIKVTLFMVLRRPGDPKFELENIALTSADAKKTRLKKKEIFIDFWIEI